MEKAKKEMNTEKLNRELIKAISADPAQTPDAHAILNELLQKTDRMEAGEIPINVQRLDQLKFAYALAQQYQSASVRKYTVYGNGQCANRREKHHFCKHRMVCQDGGVCEQHRDLSSVQRNGSGNLYILRSYS